MNGNGLPLGTLVTQARVGKRPILALVGGGQGEGTMSCLKWAVGQELAQLSLQPSKEACTSANPPLCIQRLDLHQIAASCSL